MEKSGYTEEQVLQWGATGDVFFLVMVVSSSGALEACKVPELALRHFIAGAASYTVDALPEVYTGEMLGPWTIVKERLRVVAASWDRFYTMQVEGEQTHSEGKAEQNEPAVIPPREPLMVRNKKAVLAALVNAGYDPSALPPYRNGRSDPAKSAARIGSGLSEAAFEHAWKSLGAEIKKGNHRR